VNQQLRCGMDAGPRHPQPACGCVPKIVEAEIGNPGLPTSLLEGRANLLRRVRREKPIGGLPLSENREQLQGSLRVNQVRSLKNLVADQALDLAILEEASTGVVL
jgi:hypothetical protein